MVLFGSLLSEYLAMTLLLDPCTRFVRIETSKRAELVALIIAGDHALLPLFVPLICHRGFAHCLCARNLAFAPCTLVMIPMAFGRTAACDPQHDDSYPQHYYSSHLRISFHFCCRTVISYCGQ